MFKTPMGLHETIGFSFNDVPNYISFKLTEIPKYICVLEANAHIIKPLMCLDRYLKKDFCDMTR
jgi:hypothetical protein